MKIGVDARLLSEKHHGISRYTHEVLTRLVKEPAEFFLYSPENIISNNSWDFQNVNLRTSTFSGGKVTRILWSQIQLPYQVREDQLDVFWGPCHRIPRFIPKNVAKVVSIHDLVWKHAPDTMRIWNRLSEQLFMPQSIRAANHIITDSNYVKESLASAYPFTLQKTSVINLGPSIFPNAGEPEDLKSLGVHKPYILFVGTLEPRKNLPRLLRSFGALEEHLRNKVKLVIAGGAGWGSTDIGSYVEELKLTQQVVLLGEVEDKHLSTLYKHAMFLAMPSLMEGFGLPLVEAMSFGIPILASNNSSMPEIVNDSGVLVDPLCEQDITNALQRLITDKNFRDDLQLRSRKNSERFDWDNTAKQTWEILVRSKPA